MRSRVRRQNQRIIQLRRSKVLDTTIAETDEESMEGAPPRRYKLAIIAPTPFYYQVPIFQRLSADPRIDLTVYFCSREALESRDLTILYDSNAKWGEENLLEGYKYKFMRNYAPLGSYLKTPFGLANLGIWKELAREKPDVVVLMGWTNPTWWIAILACLKHKIPFLYMNDANVQAEIYQARWKAVIKELALGKILFRLAAGFLSSGVANNHLYRYFGVPDEKLIPFGYSMVHQLMLPKSEQIQSQKIPIRSELGIPEDGFVVLFCGRFIKQKGPFDLLEAFQSLKQPNKVLVFVGGGELDKELKEYVAARNMESVYFFGFQGRQELPKFYEMSDVLVLPSWRETWGMVVNEALCFGLPVVVSDQVGAAPDLVENGSNGYIFPYKNVRALANCIEQVMNFSEEQRSKAQATSRQLISSWSERDLVGPLINYLDDLIGHHGNQDRVA